MRPLLFRVVATLLVAPPVFLIAALYVRVQTTGMPADLWPTAAKELGQLYLSYTLPAVALLVVLVPLDWLLQRIDFGLTTLVVSPLVAGLIVFGLGDLFSEPHIQQAAEALPLFVVYGLVWGLTIRDPAVWGRRRIAA